MAEKQCRNCGSTERYSKKVVHLWVKFVGLFGGEKLAIQVCGNCGLVDWFVPPERLHEVKQKLVRIA
jgi:uncharacterized Zn finger protein